MSENPQLKDSVGLAESPEPRCACVLLLDTSGSMAGSKIVALNEGLKAFKDELSTDSLTRKRVEVAIVTFDSGVRVTRDFVTADEFDPPTLTVGGLTHTGSAIEKALDIIRVRKTLYTAHGLEYYRPWIFMITDGVPCGEANEILEKAASRLKWEENQKGVAFFAVGVEGADMNQLSKIAARPPVKLRGLEFKEMFVWLSKSMNSVSHSSVNDEQVPLPIPGWGTV